MNDTTGLGGFLAALRSLNPGYDSVMREDTGVTPFGAYGMLLENWEEWSEIAGYRGANPRDRSAQDAVAGFWATRLFQRYGSWPMVAGAWYAGQQQADALFQQGTTTFTNRRIKEYQEAVRQAQEAHVDASVPFAARRWVNAGSGQGWLNPVAGDNEYSDSFRVPRDNKLGIHGAIDIYAARGAPIVSPVSGKVLAAKTNHGKGGNWVQVLGDDGNTYYFAHMEGAPVVAKGQQVNTGSHLGFVGDSGSAKGTSPHLHFSVKRGGKVLNPYSLLQGSANANGYFQARNAFHPAATVTPKPSESLDTMLSTISDQIAGDERVDARTIGIAEIEPDNDTMITPGGEVAV